MPHRACDRAVVAVQCDLDTAPEAGAVDRGKRRVRESLDPPKELVPGAAPLARLLGGDTVEPIDVGTGAEDKRLAGQHHPGPVGAFQLLEPGGQRLQGLGAEHVRLLPVLAVVHRDQRHRPGLGLDPGELELGWCAQTRSQSSAAPMPIPTQSAVSPYCTSGRSFSPYASCAISRTPVAASG